MSETPPICKACGQPKTLNTQAMIQGWEPVLKRHKWICLPCREQRKRDHAERSNQRMRDVRAAATAKRLTKDYASTGRSGRSAPRSLQNPIERRIPDHWVGTPEGAPPKPPESELPVRPCRYHKDQGPVPYRWFFRGADFHYQYGRWMTAKLCPHCKEEFKKGERKIPLEKQLLWSYVKQGLMSEYQARFCAGEVWPKTKSVFKEYTNDRSE